ncbi:hypothetical protein C2G38_2072993 [Gigaspora rosea]|uniref:Uncharacterized protein n=1 Tax=Gigaspora rosea TaxID=44941 RepID=A0A397VLP3_9GLOM|nr:hypothetical protein C2G38_2072993 [Gigaspora rosea]
MNIIVKCESHLKKVIDSLTKVKQQLYNLSNCIMFNFFDVYINLSILYSLILSLSFMRKSNRFL